MDYLYVNIFLMMKINNQYHVSDVNYYKNNKISLLSLLYSMSSKHPHWIEFLKAAIVFGQRVVIWISLHLINLSFLSQFLGNEEIAFIL